MNTQDIWLQHDETFFRFVGRWPAFDDAERMFCTEVGKIGHNQCGFCHEHAKPRFLCGCIFHRIMNYPYMLIMRNSTHGMIWQAYTVHNEQEQRILTKNANANGFIVQTEYLGYTTETSPGWRDTDDWRKCLERDQS